MNYESIATQKRKEKSTVLGASFPSFRGSARLASRSPLSFSKKAHTIYKSGRERGDRQRSGGGGDGDPGFAAATEVDNGAHPGGGPEGANGRRRHLLLAPQGRPLLRRPPLQGHPHHQVPLPPRPFLGPAKNQS